MPSFAIDHRRVYGNGVHLSVASAGKGPPVLLLHGFLEFQTSWRKQMDPLVGHDEGASLSGRAR